MRRFESGNDCLRFLLDLPPDDVGKDVVLLEVLDLFFQFRPFKRTVQAIVTILSVVLVVMKLQKEIKWLKMASSMTQVQIR